MTGVCRHCVRFKLMREYVVESCFIKFHWISGMHDLKNAHLKRGLTTDTE